MVTVGTTELLLSIQPETYSSAPKKMKDFTAKSKELAAHCQGESVDFKLPG